MLIGNGVDLQPSYYSGGNVDLGFALMKQQEKIKSVRIEIEPDQVTNATRWIKEAVDSGYKVICTYHKYKVLGSDNLSDLLDGANWWKDNYATLAKSGNFMINMMNEWGSHNLTALNYATDYNQAIAIVRTVYNGTIIIDASGYGQETYVAANAVKGIGTGNVKILDTNIVLSAHIYPGGYVQQRTDDKGNNIGSGTFVASDLDYMINSNRTCIIGEFGNGGTGSSDWSGIVDHAKAKSMSVLGWCWDGDGGSMNMISPQFQPYNSTANYPYTTSSYFPIIYAKL
ncbi:MAG: cellulase family glycosylhydrolase [Ginsengibacter sp.]